MDVIDFARSFVTFRIDTTKKAPITVTHEPPFNVNNARVVLDCRCVVSDSATGRSESYVLGASCKTERVGVKRDIWTEPNADFVPVFSSTRFMHLKSYDRLGRSVESYPPRRGAQPDRELQMVADAFDDVRIDLSFVAATRLEARDDVIAATLARSPLVARTEIETERYRAAIDYPIKTMNASAEDGIYQADTGPILLPDLGRELDDLMEGMELAFAAFNDATWIEFLVRAPTQVAEGVHVYHYSRPMRLENVKNVVFRVDGAASMES